MRERSGEGGVVVDFQKEGTASPWLEEERLVSKERKNFGWQLREEKPRQQIFFYSTRINPLTLRKRKAKKKT